MRNASQIPRTEDSESPPVSRVPDELLSYIFSKGRDPLTPVLASHICHRWRLVATGDPRLWARATLNITSRTRAERLHLLDLFLHRSEKQPLAITMYLDPFKAPEALHVCIAQRALAVLLLHARRWASLRLFLPVALFGSALCTPLDDTSEQDTAFPILRSARITLGGRRDAASTSTPTFEPSASTFLARAPVLRELEWAYQRDHMSYDLLCADSLQLRPGEAWAGLTSVVLNRVVTAPLALAVLKSAPRMELFRLRSLVLGEGGEERTVQTGGFADVHMDTVLHDDDVRTVALTLRTLSVYQLHLCPALPWLLARLVCPALCSLALSCGFNDREESELLGRELAEFLRHCAEAVEVDGYSLCGAVNGIGDEGADIVSHGRPNTGLQELLLEGVGLAPVHLVACLSHTKDLRKLQIDGMYGGVSVDDMVLQALNGRTEPTRIMGGKTGKRRGPAPLCPRLTALRLVNCISCTDGALAAMLCARLALPGFRGGSDSSMDIVKTKDWDLTRLEEVSIVLSKMMRKLNVQDAAFVDGPLRAATCPFTDRVSL